MRPFKRNPDLDLEARLRAERPEPGSGLVQTIVARTARATEVRRPRSLRVAFAVVSVAALGALGAFGGVSYAASSVQHAATAVKSVFVAKAPQKSVTPADRAGAAKSAAGDQYGGPPGPFLPPGVTAPQAAQNFVTYMLGANTNLQNALRCNTLRGAAKTACLARLQQLRTLRASLQRRLAAAAGKIGTLRPDTQAWAARLLAIQLQQQEQLVAAQTARRTNCARAAYAGAHRAICAKATPAAEAAERLRLGSLELQELEAFLAA